MKRCEGLLNNERCLHGEKWRKGTEKKKGEEEEVGGLGLVCWQVDVVLLPLNDEAVIMKENSKNKKFMGIVCKLDVQRQSNKTYDACVHESCAFRFVVSG